MDRTNEQHCVSNAPSILELQQQHHFMAQLASHVRNESQQLIQDDNDASNDYWGDEWSDDDENEDNRHVESTTWLQQEHINDDDDDDDDYYAIWSDHLSSQTPGTSTYTTTFSEQVENDLSALQELVRLLYRTLPCASTSISTLNPLPKAIQYRYEWDETSQSCCPADLV